MCSLVSARIFDIGSTLSPGHGSGAGPCCTAPRGRVHGRRERGARRRAPDAMYSSMSRLGDAARDARCPACAAISMPCSAAILRTSGEDLVRRRSSRPLPPDGGGSGWRRGGLVGRPRAACAVASQFGGGPRRGRQPAAAGAGRSAAAAAIAAPFSVSMRATTVCTATVCAFRDDNLRQHAGRGRGNLRVHLVRARSRKSARRASPRRRPSSATSTASPRRSIRPSGA